MKKTIYTDKRRNKNNIIPTTERSLTTSRQLGYHKHMRPVYVTEKDCLHLNKVLYKGKAFLKENGKYIVKDRNNSFASLIFIDCIGSTTPGTVPSIGVPEEYYSTRYLSKNTKANIINTKSFTNNKKKDRIEKIIKNKKLPNNSVVTRSNRNFKTRGR